MSFFDGCPGSKRIRQPFPEIIKCSCGKEIEIFSDEVQTICFYCRKKVTRTIPSSCLDWCKMAKDCVGPGKFKKYKEHKQKKEK